MYLITLIYIIHHLSLHAFFHKGFKHLEQALHFGCKQLVHFWQRFLFLFVVTVRWDHDEGATCGCKGTAINKAITVSSGVGMSASMVDIDEFMTVTCG